MMTGFESLLLTVFGVAIGTPIARGYARRVESSGPAPAQLAEIAARMERMEQTMEAIATEVERIAEAQRFTTKLLSTVAESPGRIGAGSA